MDVAPYLDPDPSVVPLAAPLSGDSLPLLQLCPALVEPQHPATRALAGRPVRRELDGGLGRPCTWEHGLPGLLRQPATDLALGTERHRRLGPACQRAGGHGGRQVRAAVAVAPGTGTWIPTYTFPFHSMRLIPHPLLRLSAWIWPDPRHPHDRDLHVSGLTLAEFLTQLHQEFSIQGSGKSELRPPGGPTPALSAEEANQLEIPSSPSTYTHLGEEPSL